MPNHDTVLRRVEMIAARVQANNDKRRAIIDAANKRQLVTEGAGAGPNEQHGARHQEGFLGAEARGN